MIIRKYSILLLRCILSDCPRENADEHLTMAKLIVCYTVITLRPGVRVSTLGANKQHHQHHIIMDGMHYNEKKCSPFIDDTKD